MESKLASRCTVVLIGSFILLTSYAVGQTAQKNRIVRPVDNRSMVRLQGTLHPLARSAFDQGPASPTQPMQRMTLFFQPTAEQQAALDELLTEQQDPASPNYHKWLTPEEFADRFGISSQDINVLAAWLRSQGFTVDETARSRTWIAFSGIAAQVNAAFQTSMHNYLVNGKVHYAAAIEPSVPAAFAGVVTGIGALHNFAPHARSVQAKPRLTSSLTGNHFIVPGDFATIYDLQTLYNSGFNGSGQTIAIMGQTDLTTDSNPGRNGTPGANGQQYDVVTFRNLAGLPALTSSNFQTVLVTGVTDPGVVTADANEANLDVEWSGAVAPNAKLVYVIDNPTTSNGAFGSLEWAVSNVKANIFSISYGECEPQASADQGALTAAAAQAAVQGQTIVAPSGDSGANDCNSTSTKYPGISVDFPASIPTVTAVGGTEFSADSANNADPTVATPYWAASTNDTTASALAYIPETSWNDFAITTPSLSATGGGVSTFFPQPTWQTGLGVATGRNVPDISFTASAEHDGYLVCSQASCVNGYRDATTSFNAIGGTSAPTPSFAGIVALINQKMGANQGNINPVLYAQAASAPWAFHDITTGNNIVTCLSGTSGCMNSSTIGYAAGIGYDLVTGLGSLDVAVLLNAMTGVSDFSVTPSFPNPAVQNITLTTGNSGTLALAVLGTSGSNITFACTPVAPLTATTCTAPSPVTTNGGTAVSSTLTVSTTSGYSETGAVNVTATNGSISHLVPITVVVNGTNPDFRLASTNGSETVAPGSSTTDTISVTSVNNFSGSVSLSCAGTTGLSSGLSCSFSPSSVTPSSSAAATSMLTVNASSSASTGAITITATSTANGVTLTHTLQLLVSATPGFTLSSSVGSIVLSSGQTGTATITVAPTSGFSSNVTLSCSLTPTLGATTCSLSPVTVPGGNGTSTLTINGAVLTGTLRGAPLRPSRHSFGGYATFAFALGMVFTMKPKRLLQTKGSWWSNLLGLVLLAILLGTIACGGGGSSGGGSGPTPLSGSVTVTGVSGNLTTSVSIPVTIN